MQEELDLVGISEDFDRIVSQMKVRLDRLDKEEQELQARLKRLQELLEEI